MVAEQDGREVREGEGSRNAEVGRKYGFFTPLAMLYCENYGLVARVERKWKDGAEELRTRLEKGALEMLGEGWVKPYFAPRYGQILRKAWAKSPGSEGGGDKIVLYELFYGPAEVGRGCIEFSISVRDRNKKKQLRDDAQKFEEFCSAAQAAFSVWGDTSKWKVTEERATFDVASDVSLDKVILDIIKKCVEFAPAVEQYVFGTGSGNDSGAPSAESKD